MNPRPHSARLLVLPLVAGLAFLAPISHASGGGAGGMTSTALAALTPAAVAALCGGGAAGAAAGAAAGGVAGAAAGGLLSALCSINGVPLKALMGVGSSLLSQAMQGGEGGGGGQGGGGQPSYNPGYNQVSGLPVISQPRTPDTSFNYNTIGSTIKPTVSAPVVQATQPPPPPSMYGPTVEEATSQVVRNFPTIANTGNSARIQGGVRLPNGQPAMETGIRLGGFADGTVLASNGINVGSTNIATTVQEQQIDWFTLGFADGKDGRPRQMMQTKEEQVQYDSGYNMGLQNQVRPVVVS